MTTILSTRDIEWAAPYIDQDRSRYGEDPSAQEFELRVAGTPAGAGALIDRITSVTQIVETFRTGRQLHALTSATDWSADANVTVAAYSATNPTGYAAASSLEVQGTGASSTDRGARYTFATPLDLSVFGGGTLLYIHRRCSSAANLTGWDIRFEFATTSDWASFRVFTTGEVVGAWDQASFAKGNPQATNGTVDWSNVTSIRLFADVSAAYTGNLEVRDLRIGTVQTDKTVPDDAFAWETSVDARVRYRDDADSTASTTTAASSAAAATNIKVTSITGMVAGDELTIETAGLVETRTIQTVGTAGGGGTGITVTEAYTYAHGSGDTVKVYPWGSWTSWLTLKVSEPPTVAASSPADGATVTDPTVDLVHTYASPAGKAQASHTSSVYRLAGFAGMVEASAPVSWWRLAETSSTYADEQGVASGTVNGSISRGTTGLLSPYDTSASADFDGTTGYVTFGDVYDFAGTVPFSVAALVDLDTLPGSACAIVGKEGAGSGWNVYVTSAGAIRFQRRDGSGTDTFDAGLIAIAAGTQMVVCTYDGSNMIIYVDSEFGAENASARSMVGNANNLTVGRQANGAAGFLDGRLQDVVIWDRVLTQSEISGMQAALTEAYGNQLIREHTTEDAEVTETLPAFLLEDARAYAWTVEAEDTEGLIGTTTERTFLTAFTVPDAITDLAGTADADASSVTLTWTASVDANLHHYRVYWQDGAGSWIRVDGGPAEVDDGLTPLTAATFTHHGGRLGTNHYQVTVHTGALESEPEAVEVDLTAATGGSWMFVRPDVERHTFPLRVLDAPRIHEAAIERMAPPGRGATVHLKWGTTGKRISVRVQRRPGTEGDISTRLAELQADTLPGWLKAPSGWAWDPMWCEVVSVNDTPGVGGLLVTSIDLETTEP